MTDTPTPSLTPTVSPTMGPKTGGGGCGCCRRIGGAGDPRRHPRAAEAAADRIVGQDGELFTALSEANRRLQRALDSKAPASLLERSRPQLATRLAEHLDDLLDV